MRKGFCSSAGVGRCRREPHTDSGDALGPAVQISQNALIDVGGAIGDGSFETANAEVPGRSL